MTHPRLCSMVADAVQVTDPVVRTLVARLVLFGAERPRPRVRDFAQELGVAPRTLRRRLEAHQAPPPARIITAGRILRTVRRLPYQSAAQAALRTGWPDQYQFYSALKRHTGLRTTEARDRSLQSVTEAWAQRARPGGRP